MQNKNKLDLWVKEVFQDNVSLGFRVEEVLFSEKSKYQQVDIVKTTGHGKMLLNDGMVMLSEKDEFVYHEMIAHVPIFSHPNPDKILIIGGGDGGTAREVLKHKNVRKVTLVEIDELVVNACKKHLPKLSKSFEDPKMNLLIDDGVKFVNETKEKFDIILVDSTDPVGPATPLFNREFYESASKILNDDGILISQAESPFYNQDIQLSMMKAQRDFFKTLNIFLLSNLTYPGGLWSFGFASKGNISFKTDTTEKFKDSGIKMKYYNPDVHLASFVLPDFIKENLSGIIDN